MVEQTLSQHARTCLRSCLSVFLSGLAEIQVVHKALERATTDDTELGKCASECSHMVATVYIHGHVYKTHVERKQLTNPVHARFCGALL